MKCVNKLGGSWWMVVPAIKMKRWKAMRRDGERREDSMKAKDDVGGRWERKRKKKKEMKER